MNSPGVEIISKCFIKPKCISQEANNPIYLSPWDLPMFNVNYIQKGLLFPFPFPSPEFQDFSLPTFLDHLKHSLSATLTHFHPLAARLATKIQHNPPSYVVYLSLENSPGAGFIHAAVNLTVSDILTPTDVPLIVQSFFDHDRAIAHDGHERPLLTVQVTELLDGIFVGCSINHMVADGASYWHFFNSLSEVFNSDGQNGHLQPPISRPPVLRRWVQAGSDPIISLPFTHHDQFIKRPNPPLLRERIFRFSSHSLSKLKSKVNSECNTTKISTLQALSALIWRCVTRARRLPADSETGCRLAMNNRSRLSPPLPENYFGNSISTVRGTATAEELLRQGIGWAAWMLHKAVAGHDDKAIQEWVGSWMKSPFVFEMDRLFDPNSIQMGSSPRFDMYGNEFGLGKGVAVLSGYGNKFDGKVTLYPGRDGGGAMDLEVCLLPENMAAFEEDEELICVLKGEAFFKL